LNGRASPAILTATTEIEMRARTSAAGAAFLAASLALLAPARAEDEEAAKKGEGRKESSFGFLGGPWIGILRADAHLPVSIANPLGLGSASGVFSSHVHDYDVMPYAEVFGTFKFVSLYADVWYGDWTDHTTADGAFTLGGETFSASTPIRTNLKVLTFGGRVQVNPIATKVVELGLSVGARYFRIDTTVEDTAPGVQAKDIERVEAPLPQVGASLTFFVKRWADIYVRARGFDFSYESYHVTNLEGEAGLAVNLGDNIAFGAEYRLFYASLDGRQDQLGDYIARLQGPLIYARLRF
jgi:hypothetical protein